MRRLRSLWLLATIQVTTCGFAHVAARQRSQAAHLREIESGHCRYGCAPRRSNGEHRIPREYDGAFVTHDAGAGNAGPDERLLHGGHLIHATAAPVLTADECEEVIAEAAEAMEAGRSSSFTYTAAQRISEVHVHDLPKAREWLRERLHQTFFPLLCSRFGSGERPTTGADAHVVVAPSELAVYDALVIRYDAERGGTRQPTHRDASLLSLNIALSDTSDYEGGGTHFESLGSPPLKLERGHAMCHASGIRHAGYSISAGIRWVLVIFVLAERAPQHARRCGEDALEAKRRGDASRAKELFEAAIAACPNDHEAHHGLASVHATCGDSFAARARLSTAIRLYSSCPKPHNALGSLLLGAGRPRAALRRFEAALSRSLEPDDDDGWDASVNMALCLITLAKQEAAAGKGRGESARGGFDSWRQRIPEARALLTRSLESYSDDRLLALVRDCDKLEEDGEPYTA
jgi:tetratricopeptide (TPR) repeat protein